MATQVLVVEDEKLVAKSIQNELRDMGYSVPAIASSGPEALEKAAETHPDLVLMDIVLKGDMDGIQTAEQMRSRFDVPVIYLTAYADKETLGRARTTDPFGYLLKPYEETELYCTIEMALYKHRMEKKLKETNQWLDAILQGIADAVIATDGRQVIRLMNPMAEILSGWDRKDALGKDLFEVCNLVSANGRTALEPMAKQAISQGEAVRLADDVHFVSVDGRTAPVEGSIAPLHDADGNYAGLVLVVRDITKRKQAERLQRQGEEHLRYAQKMETVGRLAGGVAHQFNNLLTPILGNTSLLLSGTLKNSAVAQPIEQIEAAALRAAEVVKQLLAFSGRRGRWLEVVNLNELAEETLTGMRQAIDSRIDIDFQPGEEPWLIQADRAQMSELLRNLCLNAQDAMPEAGHLHVETANVTIKQGYHGPNWEAQPGEYVRLQVKDSGRGMTPEIQERIFEPFFTTKEAGKGTGLGLALVFGIVEEHGGWIECESTEGQGTCFDVYLPRYGHPGDVPEAPIAAKKPRGAVATILLADDEEMIRDLGSTILKRMGYRVLLAEDGLQALDMYRREQQHIDLVILDLTMPRLSGYDTFRQLVEVDPQVHVLFSSGYFAEDLIATDSRIMGFISKPYRYEELVHMVRSALEHLQSVNRNSSVAK